MVARTGQSGLGHRSVLSLRLRVYRLPRSHVVLFDDGPVISGRYDLSVAFFITKRCNV